MQYVHFIGLTALLWFFICLIGAARGNEANRPTAIVGAALFLIAVAIAFK